MGKPCLAIISSNVFILIITEPGSGGGIKLSDLGQCVFEERRIGSTIVLLETEHC